MNINDVCDYVIHRVIESGESLSNLKLQKLLYYVQSWHLAFESKPLFNGKFQAWVHGPVSREIYSRFSDTKSLYSDINQEDISQDFEPEKLDSDCKSHIDRVLSVYAKYSGPQLEEMTHKESPWVEAREGYSSWERCEVELNENTMMECYSKRLQ